MKKVLLVLMLLSGCGYNEVRLTNEQIVAEKNLCAQGGMDYVLLSSAWTGRCIAVECIHPKVAP